jgi:hypothetical protein
VLCLGGGRGNLFHILSKDFDSNVAVDRMSRLARLCSRWITNHGFSVGISDVQPSQVCICVCVCACAEFHAFLFQTTSLFSFIINFFFHRPIPLLTHLFSLIYCHFFFIFQI